MFKLIPSHSLVITVGPNHANRAAYVSKYFPDYEVTSAADVCCDLVGETERPDLNSIVFAELRRRVALKLSLGERVVVQAPNLRREDRLSLARLATEIGIPVFYLLCDPAGADEGSLARLKATERDLARGDGVAELIDWRTHSPQPVPKAKPSFDVLRTYWSGITVLGDIHGMQQSLLSALSWARSRRHYVIFIGDVIDYGPNTLEVADEVYRVVTRGDGELILGNHERKIARWLAQAERGRYNRLSEGNKVTTDALNALGPSAKAKWEGRFKGLVARAESIRCIGNVAFAHAGVHPDYWTGTATHRDVESVALFGEFEPIDGGGRPERKYNWVSAIPQEFITVTGHDIRAQHPLKETNSQGGTAIFLDTGCGKGGLLSSADFKFTETGLKLECFNMY